ncbi:MAG: exopolyphosphatase [Candidatus Eremiobacteraeota bacterium]|nr:exopolyphosphatase [Candidatus Eremiobacteraeota bacterium]MBV8354156.1 exopolyphosphatase [Candidatus Eremiobacteraeota bacterium]
MKLITRADLDGLTCSILLSEVEKIEDIELVHPKDVQDGKIKVTKNDVLANLPYNENAGLWFDHHLSQADASWADFQGAYDVAPSAARVIANHYKSPNFAKYEQLLEATDRMDAAELTREDIVEPKGWILIGYTLDPRTALADFRPYFKHVAELAKVKTPEEILEDPQVKQRVEQLTREEKEFLDLLKATSRADGNVILSDYRGRGSLPHGNRFLVYTLFPAQNVSVRIADGFDKKFASIQVGHSILNRTCKTNVGDLMAEHGGGGHFGAGTCQPPSEDANRVLGEIIKVLKDNG